MLGEGRLVGSTGWGGFGSGRRREETVRAERSQRQLRLAWLGHSGAFPPLKDLSLCPGFVAGHCSPLHLMHHISCWKNGNQGVSAKFG